MTVRIATDSRPAAEKPAPLTVAAELEAIFKPLPQPVSPPRPDTGRSGGRPTRGRHAGRWAAILVALALVVAVASIALLARTARAPLPHPQPQPARPAPVVGASGAQQVRPPAALVRPAQAISYTAQEQHTIPQPRAAVTDKADRARPLGRRFHQGRRGRRQASRCRAGATSAWCLHGAVVAADDRLRGAYAAAIRAGVDHGTLEGVRSDWSRLRRRANKDPEAMIRGYGLLTQELRAEAQRTGRR